jgi:hypothetical protein
MEEICQQDVSMATAELSGAQTLPEQLEIVGKFLIKKRITALNGLIY